MRTPNAFRRRDILTGLASVLVPRSLLRAQDVSPTFSAGVTVVNVFVSVRDRSGAIVKGLVKEDFTLEEEGKPQTIRYFSQENDLPLTVGLLVDTTPSESNMLEEERRASREFFDRMLRPETDKAFVIQYNNEVELLQDVTSSREKLDRGLSRLEAHASGGRGRGRQPSANALADAVFLASDEILSAQKGRKALLILGDGDHVGSHEEMAIAAAHRADTLVYAIRIWDKGRESGVLDTMGRIPGLGIPGQGRGQGRGGGQGGPQGRGGPSGEDGKSNLKTLSARTGGGYFEVTRRQTLQNIYARIEEELRNLYSLGYDPDPPAPAGYRRIQAGARKKGLTVRGREGYYATGRP